MGILITNNPLAEAEFGDNFRVEYHEASMLGILVNIRDRVHRGHQLLTHPLTGSLKPNETPYKSVLISDNPGNIDPRSVQIIEECILALHKFTPGHISENCLPDLRAMDLFLIRSALENLANT